MRKCVWKRGCEGAEGYLVCTLGTATASCSGVPLRGPEEGPVPQSVQARTGPVGLTEAKAAAGPLPASP